MKSVGTIALGKVLTRQFCMMSSQRYAQATSEESTELVTNRASVKQQYWNPAIASYEEEPSQTSANLASGLSNLHLSSHTSHPFSASASTYHPQFTGSTAFPNIQSETHGSQNVEVSETRQTDHHLKSEKNRLGTFDGRWPTNSYVRPQDLAKAGFYFVGVADVVRCIFCQISLKAWERGDVPMDEHRKHSPSCPFVLQQNVGNAPLQNVQILSPSESFPLEWRNMFRTRPDPACPEYADANNRLRSFAGIHLPGGQTAEAFANAGFFYIGPNDNVRCYWCGGSLKAWQPTDQPVAEHFRWFPGCRLSQQQQIPFQTQPFLLSDTMRMTEDSHLQHPVTAASEGDDESMVMSQPAHEEMEITSTCTENESESETGSVSHSTQTQPGQTKESKDVESLKEENRRLKDSMLCKVCMDKDISTLFLPCSHLVCCDDCAPTLHECPICRTAIRGSVRTFIS